MIGRIILAGAFVSAISSSVLAERTSATPEPVTVVVKMIDVSLTEYRFEPSNITVKKGDIVKWVQTGPTPHNVDFTEIPELAGAAASPYLVVADQEFELVIDDRFAAGENKYVCTPHAFMGMTGTLTVEGG